MQFVLNHKTDEALTIAETKPSYTTVWNHYASSTLFEDLKNVLERSDGAGAGEYIFFPVKDDKIFLPPETAYDLSPHKLDILCQNIRTIERENKWRTKRIIIVGDRLHRSYVCSEDEKRPLKKTEDIISLESIAKKYKNVTLLDPTDIVMKRIIEIAAGRAVVLSKNIRDALIRNGYKKHEFIYVPELVLKQTAKTAAEQ